MWEGNERWWLVITYWEALSRSQTNTIFEGHRLKESDMLHLSSRLHVAVKLKWRMNRLRLSLNTETNLFLV